MSGPVWRFESALEAGCAVCHRTVTGVFVEGEVAANGFRAERQVCPECYGRLNRMLVRGELGSLTAGPAYAHR
jgi:hypothetical protein